VVAVGTIQHDTVIDAPAEQVWAAVADVGRLPELSRHTVEVRDAPARLTSIGQTFTQVVKVAGKRFESSWEVRHLDPGRSLAIEGDVGHGVRYCLREEVEPLGPDRSRFGIHITYALPLGVLGRLAARIGVERRARQEAAEVVEGMKALVERGSGVVQQ
jgi:uncharacterized membrane protein